MNKKILVIDDEPHIVKVIKSRLEANDYKVITAFNGKEGLVKVQDEDPDIIIVDILMSEMDGYTFVRELKKTPKKIPVIVLTAKTGMAEIFRIEGIDDYVCKPFETEELLGKIEKHLNANGRESNAD